MALTTAFARNGNKKAVPQTTQDGSVSYDQGFGNLYALPPEEGGLFIDRAQFNQIMYDTTSAVITNQNSISTLNTKVTANQKSINTLNTKVADLESSVSTGVVSLTGNQTIAGVKTFSSPPISATNPTANNQVANKAYVDTVTNTKANANATVNLTGNQSIAGAKTFTSNITAPNITTLQSKVSSIENTISQVISSDVTPIGVYKNVENKTIGTNGDFKTIHDAFIYAQTHQKQGLSQKLKLTLLQDFNQDLYFTGAWYPHLIINCNGFSLGSTVVIDLSCFYIQNLKLSNNIIISNSIFWFGGDNININYQNQNYGGGCIATLGATFLYIRASNITLRSIPSGRGIVAQGNSQIALVDNSTITQTTGANCFNVTNGGIIQIDNRVNLTGVTITKANQAANTITKNGIIFGNYVL